MKTPVKRRSRIFVAALFAVVAQRAHASGYIVGNGDDGGDLEGGTIVKSGILIDTRAKALERLKKLGTESVPNLGLLIPELEKSDIYLVSRAIAPKIPSDQGQDTGEGSEVFARTFTESLAATRFFPAALTLNEEQLIALHIHEALHRALPPAVRGNESIVSDITLAITGPGANIDRVRRVVDADIPKATTELPGAGPSTLTLLSRAELMEELRTAERASTLTYSYHSYFLPHRSSNNSYPIDSLHELAAMFYPMKNGILGLGMDFTYVRTLDEAFMGPLSLSARIAVATINDYDLTAYTNVSLNTTAGEQIKNSPLGRDVTTIGLMLRRDAPHYYVEETLGVSLEGEAKRQVGGETDTYHYGKMIAATVRAGARLKHFELGGFADLLLSDSYKSSSTDPAGATQPSSDIGRFRIFGAGPEIAYSKDSLRVAAAARWVIDSTPGVSLDDIGDLMGWGVGQGSLTVSASLRF